ncbi:MAG: hypothetical protein Q8S24_01260 [Eubacteriales bacterium]|nr:hypothetical protein [Eubacteriales bacterium]
MTGRKIIRKAKLLIEAVKMRFSMVSIKRLAKSLRYHFTYKAKAKKDKIIWIDVQAIQKALANEKLRQYAFTGIMDGDWDLETRDAISQKVIGIEQHYIEGTPWRETALFKYYEKRFQNELLILRCKDLDELEDKYNTTINALYENIKTGGYRLPTPENPDIGIIYVYIGREGEILFSGNGNHRLAIARILGIDRIPVTVKARHKQWQNIREAVHLGYNKGQADLLEKYRHLLDHPDLTDIIS